jgi:hypothetical protein
VSGKLEVVRPDPRRPHQKDKCLVCLEDSEVYIELGRDNASTGIKLCDACARRLGSSIAGLVGTAPAPRVTAEELIALIGDSYDLRYALRRAVNERD